MVIQRRVSAAGTLILTAAVIHDNLNGTFFNLRSYPFLEPLALALFVFSQGWVAAEKVSADERRLLSIENELAIAREIQASILPRVLHMITILGAGGAIGNELVKLLSARKQSFRLVGRNPRNVVGATEAISADIADQEQTIRAVAGSSVVHLLVGLKYDHKLWAEMWPRIMSNTIESCKRAGAKLVFFDNVYMYGKVSGPMTEQTLFNPCSKKGEIRAKIANSDSERA